MSALFDSCFRFSVNWTGKEGLDIDTHKDYIKDFCNHFDKSIKRLVDNAVKKNDELLNDRIYADILQVDHCGQMGTILIKLQITA